MRGGPTPRWLCALQGRALAGLGGSAAAQGLDLLPGWGGRAIADAMLDVMRRQSYLIYLIFGAIILIFAVNFGPGSAGCARGLAAPATWAARVNGEVIKPQDFGAQLAQRMESIRRMSEERGQEFDPVMAERMGVRRIVMDQMVERRLVSQEAASHGVQIPDAALLRYLRRTFGVHRVSYDTYAEWVTRSFGTSVAHFEDQARRDAGGELWVRAMQDSIAVSDSELRAHFVRDHDRVKGTYVRLASDDFAAQVAPAEEAAVAAAMEQEPQALEAQYSKDIATYRTPPRAHLRQIVRLLDRDATEKDVRQARELLMGVRAQVEGGADFSVLAQQHSQDATSRERGGDLGLVDQGTLAPDLERVAFGLEPGKVAPEPVRTPEGLHLVQTLEVQAAGLTPLGDVRHEVAQHLLRDRAARLLAMARAERLLTELKAGKAVASLTQAEAGENTHLTPSALTQAHVDKLPVLREFGWTRRTDEAIARIGLAPELQAALFAQNGNEPLVRRVFPAEDGFYVTLVGERETPRMADFAAARKALHEEVLAQKQQRVLTDWLAYLKTQGKIELNPQVLNAPLAQGPEEGQS